MKKKSKKIEIVEENLLVGDFLINNSLIIERKTLSDLASSIYDGRYKEQSMRLRECIDENTNLKVFYFIEGNTNLYIPKSNISISALKSAMFSLQYEKGFFVVQTQNIMDTVELLVKYTEKHEKSQSKTHSGTTPIIQKSKGSQINETNMGAIMLSNVPGLSMASSSQILTHFNNDIYEFLFEIHHDISILDTIKINNRKLSKSVVDNIQRLLIKN